MNLWNGTATLQSAITATDTQIKTQGQPGQLAAGEGLEIEGERMVITSVAGSSTYNVQRGTSGQAAAHAAGVKVYQIPDPTSQADLNSAWCGDTNAWQVIGGVWCRAATVG